MHFAVLSLLYRITFSDARIITKMNQHCSKCHRLISIISWIVVPCVDGLMTMKRVVITHRDGI